MYRQHVGSQGVSRVCTRIPAIPGGAVGSAKNTRYMIGGLGAILQRGPHGERTDLDGFRAGGECNCFCSRLVMIEMQLCGSSCWRSPVGLMPQVVMLQCGDIHAGSSRSCLGSIAPLPGTSTVSSHALFSRFTRTRLGVAIDGIESLQARVGAYGMLCRLTELHDYQPKSPTVAATLTNMTSSP